MKKITKKIVKDLSQLKYIKGVFLYGSFARGEASSKSDIDLFILTDSQEFVKPIQEKIMAIETEIGRNIQPTIRTISELNKTDSGLLQNIFQEGKILYLKEPLELPTSTLLKQKPYIIYSFQLNNLSQNDKARFNNYLYGRIKNKYKYTGLLQQMNGQKLSPGCVIVPYSQKSRIEKLFKRFKVQFAGLKLWK